MDTLVKWFAGLLGVVVVYRLLAYIWNGSMLKFLIASSAVGLVLAWLAWNKYRKAGVAFGSDISRRTSFELIEMILRLNTMRGKRV